MRGRTVNLLAIVVLILLSVQVTKADHAPVPGCAPGPGVICGVKICGIHYDCSMASDTVCPSDYQPGSLCGVPDFDCSNPETYSALSCNDGGTDNDGDGLSDAQDYTLGAAPATPGLNRAQSCNVCDVAECNLANANGGNTRFVKFGITANPVPVNETYVNGTAIWSTTVGHPRLDPDGSTLSQSCWCGTCAAGYAWFGGLCRAPPTITLGVNPLSATGSGTVTQLTATGTVSAIPATVQIDTNNNTGTYELSCAVAASGAYSCAPAMAPIGPLPVNRYQYNALITDGAGVVRTAFVYFDVTNGPAISSFIAASTVNSTPHYTSLALTGTFSTASATFEIDTNNNTAVFEQTVSLAGSPNTFTLPVGPLVPGVYQYNARITDTNGVSSPIASVLITVVAGPQITAFNSLPPSTIAPATVTLTATATFGAPAATIRIDNDTNNATYEAVYNIAASPSSRSAQAFIAAAPAKTYYVQVNDSYGKRVNGSVTVPITANQPPTVPVINQTVVQRFNFADATLNVTVADDQAGFNASVDWGDGNVNQFMLNMPVGNQTAINLIHTYAASAVPYNVVITATDVSTLTGINTTIINAPGLPCVQGNFQGGNATYSNTASECCSNTCAGVNSSGWTLCLAVSACFPNNQSICGGVNPTPPPNNGFVDRDTSQATCAVVNPSCQLFTWADFNNSVGPTVGRCCGDDVGDVLVQNPNIAPAGQTACCAAPNNCYTNVGLNSGCRVQAAESGAACGDLEDNDCNGFIDDGAFCQSSIVGNVTINDPATGISSAVGAYVGMESFNATTNGSGEYSISAAVPPNTYSIYAGLLGYSVQTKTVTTNFGLTAVVDFQLTPRVCNANCTNAEGFCDRTCIGVGACQPTAPELQTLYLCHPAGQTIGYPANTPVISFQNNTTIIENLCCLDPVGTARNTPVPKIEGSPEAIGRLTRTFANGLRLVIITWYS